MRMMRTQPTSHYAPFSRVGRATHAYSFEFKTLRLHRGLSLKIAINYIEPSYWLSIGHWLRSGLSYAKTRANFVFTPYFAH